MTGRQLFSASGSDGAQDAPEMPEANRTALFLDFDGTLVEIAPRPDAVTLDPEIGDVLRRLHLCTSGRVAVVSGRHLAELERLLPNYRGVLVGSHGAETRIDGIHATATEGDDPAFEAGRDRLRTWVKRQDGVLLEEKPASLVLHYRQAPDRARECGDMLAAVARVTPGFVVRPAKMAVELMPETVGKERAVRDLLERWRDRVPIAIGDDRTDEGMFAAAEAGGGHGIKVGEGETVARFRLGGVAEVHALLRHWAERSESMP